MREGRPCNNKNWEDSNNDLKKYDPLTNYDFLNSPNNNDTLLRIIISPINIIISKKGITNSKKEENENEIVEKFNFDEFCDLLELGCKYDELKYDELNTSYQLNEFTVLTQGQVESLQKFTCQQDVCAFIDFFINLKMETLPFKETPTEEFSFQLLFLEEEFEFFYKF